MAFDRHRDKNGAMSRKHGNTLIRTLRKHYGRNFALGCDDDKLSDVLHKVDEPSMIKLVRDHDDGKPSPDTPAAALAQKPGRTPRVGS
jgi:hypothetical protein